MLNFLKHPLAKFLISILTVFAPIQNMLLAIGVVVGCDLILGLWAAKKRGEKWTSSGLYRTAVKTFVYLSAVCLAFVAQKFIINDMFQLVNIVGTFIALTEMVSILESLNEINGSPVFAILIEKLKKDKEE